MKNAFQENEVGVRVKCENRSLDELRGELSFSEESAQETQGSLHYKNNSLHLLYDCTVDPFADLLQGDEIIIVPDGPLCLTPYAALVDNDSRYLSESIRIRMLPSLTSLKAIVDSPEDYHKKSGVLLVGDPCLEDITKRGRPILPQLQYARKEVMMIGEILNAPTLTGRQATKEEVLKRITSVALVHIDCSTRGCENW